MRIFRNIYWELAKKILKTKVGVWGTRNGLTIFEQFFLKRGNDPYYRTGYIYDVPNNTILNYDNAVKVAPKLRPVINMQKSELLVMYKRTY